MLIKAQQMIKYLNKEEIGGFGIVMAGRKSKLDYDSRSVMARVEASAIEKPGKPVY